MSVRTLKSPAALPAPLMPWPLLGFFLSWGHLHASPSRVLSDHREHQLGWWCLSFVLSKCRPWANSTVRKRKRKTWLFIFRSLQFRPKSRPRWCKRWTSQSCFENAGCVSDHRGAVDHASAWADRAQGSQIQSGAQMSVFVNTPRDRRWHTGASTSSRGHPASLLEERTTGVGLGGFQQKGGILAIL